MPTPAISTQPFMRVKLCLISTDQVLSLLHAAFSYNNVKLKMYPETAAARSMVFVKQITLSSGLLPMQHEGKHS